MSHFALDVIERIEAPVDIIVDPQQTTISKDSLSSYGDDTLHGQVNYSANGNKEYVCLRYVS